jgi:hypothetical protein
MYSLYTQPNRRPWTPFAGNPSVIRFAGDSERREHYQWLSQWPETSRHKLRAINRAAVSPNFPARVSHNVKHIVMALRAAMIDPQMREMVKRVISCRQGLHRAKREFLKLTNPPPSSFFTGYTPLPASSIVIEQARQRYAQEAERMQDLHIAIDWATGVAEPFTIPAKRLPLVEENPHFPNKS